MIRLQEGDRAAFDEIVEKWQGKLIGYFIRISRDRQLSEDLAQETLLKIYSQSWDYLPLGRFRSWLFRIAHNLFIDDYRKRSHDALIRAARGRTDDGTQAVDLLLADAVALDENLHRSEVLSCIQEALDEIPEVQRSVFVLHYFEEIPLDEVCEIMETPLATTKSRLRLAKEKLAEKLTFRGLHLRPET
ncbi:MAG: sigma-70 family RNA polymerase sigma factor [Planctomycetaceae bacterium]